MGLTLFNYQELKKIRKAAGFTQHTIAQALNKDRVTIARLELGATESLELLSKYADFLGRDYREFLLPTATKHKQKNFCGQM